MLLLLALAVTPPAAAQGLDATGASPIAEDGDLQDLILMWRPEPQTPKALGISLGFGYIDAPYWPVDRPSRGPMLDSVQEFDLSVSYGLHERVGLGISWPFFPISYSNLDPDNTNESSTNPFALGDVRLMAPIGLIVPDFNAGGFGLSVIPYGGLPTGSSDLYLGDGGLSGGIVLAPSYSWLGLAQVTGQIGIGGQPERDLPDRFGGAHVVGGIGAGIELHRTLAVRGELVFEQPLKAGSEAPGVFLSTLRGRYRSGFTWTAGGGMDLGNFGLNSFRVFTQIGWATVRPMDRDIDLDQIVDADDGCRFKEEVYNNYRDTDGCPDELASLRLRVMNLEGNSVGNAKVGVETVKVTTDEAGWAKVIDFIPETEPTIVIDARGYRPVMVREILLQPGDNESVITLDWQPIELKIHARASDTGLPVDTQLRIEGPGNVESQSTGDDGITSIPLRPGPWRVAAYADHFEEQRFELDLEPGIIERVLDLEFRRTGVSISKEEVVNEVSIIFPLGSDTWEPAWKPFINDLAQTLLMHDYIDVVIHGHADPADGDAPALAQGRAEAAKAFLESQTIDGSRLTIQAHGTDLPAHNAQAFEGASARVDFELVPPEHLVINETVTFEAGSTDLSEAGRARVGVVAGILTADPSWRIEIEGHADASDGEGLYGLTASRAEVVRKALVEAGVEQRRLVVKARGDTEAASTLAMANRRVSFQALPRDDIQLEIPFEEQAVGIAGEFALERLEAVASKLVAAPHIRVEVHGHRGDEEATGLSKERATAVIAALEERGVSSQQLLRIDRGFEKAGSKVAFKLRIRQPAPYMVHFEPGEATLVEGQEDRFDAMARRLLVWPRAKIDVVGRTTASDGEAGLAPESPDQPVTPDEPEQDVAAELGLAHHRAQVVFDALVQRGISDWRMNVVAEYLSEDLEALEVPEEPVDPESEEALLGRRVELRIK